MRPYATLNLSVSAWTRPRPAKDGPFDALGIEFPTDWGPFGR